MRIPPPAKPPTVKLARERPRRTSQPYGKFTGDSPGRRSSPHGLRLRLRPGADDADSAELLAEAQALQSAFYDLDGKTRPAGALDELVMAVSVETLEHEEDCRCGLCRALEAVEG